VIRVLSELAENGEPAAAASTSAGDAVAESYHATAAQATDAAAVAPSGAAPARIDVPESGVSRLMAWRRWSSGPSRWPLTATCGSRSISISGVNTDLGTLGQTAEALREAGFDVELREPDGRGEQSLLADRPVLVARTAPPCPRSPATTASTSTPRARA
jgi:hypothetical protein